MKKTRFLPLFAAAAAASALMFSGAARADAALAQKKNCMACHQVAKKVVGPAYKDIAKKYTAKDEAMLAEKVIKGGKGVWGPVPMPPNSAVSPADAEKLVKWILSLK